MTKEQFEDIKNKAWSLCRGNMLEWAIRTLKDTSSAPKWIKEMFNGIKLETSLNNDDFLEQYRDEIETLLVAFQEQNFDVDYSGVLLKFFVARRDNNELGMIEALCRMIIIAMNAGQSQGISEEEFSHCNLTKPLREHNSGIYCLEVELLKLGFTPYLCLLETIKELESRTGAWDNEKGEWCEFIGAYSEDEAVEKAEENFDCGFLLNMRVLKEDENFWLVGDNKEEFNKEQSLDDIKREFQGACVKIRKWYKADYSKCK